MPRVTEANRKWWILGAISFSLFLIMLDNTVVTVALPAIDADLGTSLSELQWIVNAYAIAFAVLLLLGGKLADYLGRRRVFLAGLVVFGVASLACGLAQSGEALIAGRAAQGLGAALMLPATLSIVAATFPIHQRGLALGLWAGISGVALAIGPLVGGALVEVVSWEWIFYINLPIGALGIAATLAVVPESRDTSAGQTLDAPGLLLGGVAVMALLFALIQANDYGWTSPTILSCFVVGTLALTAFVVVEARRRAPMLDLSLFRSPTFTAANMAGLLTFLSLFGFTFFMSIYLQDVLGYSALETGLVFLASTAATALASPLGGKASDIVGARWPITIGLTLFGGAQILIVAVLGLSTETTARALLPWVVVLGIGLGLAMPPLTAAALGAVAVEKAGVAAGVLQTFRQLGGGLGVAITGAIVAAATDSLTVGDAGYRAAFVDGLEVVLLVSGGLLLAGALMSVLAVGRHAELELAPAGTPS